MTNNVLFLLNGERTDNADTSGSLAVPLILWQTAPLSLITNATLAQLPLEQQRSLRSWHEKCPKIDHRLLTDQQMRAFIADRFEMRVLRAFDRLIPGAYRADLWRYCALYAYGGFYADFPMYCWRDLSFLRKYQLVLTRDLNPTDIYNAFMACRPRHPFLLQCIQVCVTNTEAGAYTKGSLGITGPAMVGSLLRQQKASVLAGLCTLAFVKTGEGLFTVCSNDEKKTRLVDNKHAAYGAMMAALHYKAHYSIMWRQRVVFGSIIPASCEPTNNESIRIFQTVDGEYVAPETLNCLSTWPRQNPGCGYYCVHGEHRRTFLQQYATPAAVQAHDTLTSGLLRGELWAAWALAHNGGGVYVAANMSCCISVKAWPIVLMGGDTVQFSADGRVVMFPPSCLNAKQLARETAEEITSAILAGQALSMSSDSLFHTYFIERRFFKPLIKIPTKIEEKKQRWLNGGRKGGGSTNNRHDSEVHYSLDGVIVARQGTTANGVLNTSVPATPVSFMLRHSTLYKKDFDSTFASVTVKPGSSSPTATSRANWDPMGLRQHCCLVTSREHSVQSYHNFKIMGTVAIVGAVAALLALGYLLIDYSFGAHSHNNTTQQKSS